MRSQGTSPEQVSRLRRSAEGVSPNGLFIPFPQDWRACILPAIGLATPIGLLVVNFSAWVISQLAAFRLGVAISAFISACILNGIAAVNVYRYVRSRWPDLVVSLPENFRWVVLAATAVVLITAVLAALFSYVGMEKPKDLPNGIAVITAFLGLVVPLGLSTILNRRQRGITI